MRRFTLLFLLLGFMAYSYGQVYQVAKDAPVNQPPQTDKMQLGPDQKGGGDLIWGTTFNWADPAEPRGWKLPAGWDIGDVLDNGFVWLWTKDTIKGRYTNVAPPSFFTTRADGFIAVPIDNYNTQSGVATQVSDTWIQTAPINCSAVSSVVVKFTQYFRLCCSNYNLEMLVTNDDGVHWATYSVRYAVAGNTFTPVRFRNVEINISDVAAGMNNVKIRFYMHGPSHYFWAIDDLNLTEAYDYDLVLEDYWAGFNGGYGPDDSDGHINYWPLTQMGMNGELIGKIGEYYFRSAHLNQGIQDNDGAKLNVSVLKNGTEVANLNSPGMNLWKAERDTQRIATPFLATDYGDYQFNYTAVMDYTDEIPANNKVSLRFTVNDSLFHRADSTAESSANTGGWVGGNNAGDMVGVSYDIYAPCEINSITAYLTSFTVSANPQFQFVLMKDIDGNYEEWAVSDVFDMDSTYMNRWVTKEIGKDGETEFLEAGNYAACVRMWGDAEGDADGINGMSVGWDMDTKPARTLMYQAVGGAWYSTGKLNMIGFNINQSGGPAQAPVTFNVDMNKHITNGEFHPGSDFMDVAGSFNGWGGSAHMEDADADGIYTITIAGLPVGEKIEFKYRINGNWDTSEFPAGGPNRTYIVRYWNVLNHIYNNGITTGLVTDALFASFNVYPNPNDGVFTVDVVNSTATNLEITLMNVQGQVVYQNRVSNVQKHQEVIDNNLSKGLYFLTVNNGKEVKVSKIIVR